MSSIDIGKYIEHLSRISIKYFQCELFILQLYNIIMKQWMLRFASFQIHNNTSVENFAKNLDLEDIRDILNQRKRNGSSSFGYIRYSSSSQFIHAIDAIIQLYNIIMKQWMLRFASFQIRNNTSVENFAKNLDLEDIRDILNQRKRNGSSSFGYIRYSSSSQFIHAIDAITKTLPHTNASARKTKNVGECLRHHLA